MLNNDVDTFSTWSHGKQTNASQKVKWRKKERRGREKVRLTKVKTSPIIKNKRQKEKERKKGGKEIQTK